MSVNCCLIAASISVSVSAYANVSVVEAGHSVPQSQRDSSASGRTVVLGEIHGHIVATDSGKALRDAVVRAVSVGNGKMYSTTSELDGRYRLAELPPDRYRITATKPGYLATTFGGRKSTGAGDPVLVVGRATLRVDLSLSKGAVIVGRVLDALGEAVPDARVTSLRITFDQNRRRIVPTGRMAITNDIGEFRIFGLHPGKYFLAAQPPLPATSDQLAEPGSSPVATYYPNSASGADAAEISVESEDANLDATVILVEARVGTVSGAVYDRTGRPFAGGVIAAYLKGLGDVLPKAAVVGRDGSFRISRLAPGEYILVARAVASAPDAATAKSLITIDGQNVDNLQLFAVEPASIRGAIRLPSEGSLPSKPTHFRLSIAPVDQDDPTEPAAVINVRNDLTFSTRRHEGRYLVRLDKMTVAQGWALKAVRSGNIDVTDQGIELRRDDSIEVEVELTRETAEISGVLTGPRELVEDSSVIAFSSDLNKLHLPQSRYVATASVAHDGQFAIRGLPPGSYYLAAVSDGELANAHDQDSLVRIAAHGLRVNIGASGTYTYTIPVRLPNR